LVKEASKSDASFEEGSAWGNFEFEELK